MASLCVSQPGDGGYMHHSEPWPLRSASFLLVPSPPFSALPSALYTLRDVRGSILYRQSKIAV